MANLTRIKNNQITDGTILANTKIAAGSIVGSLFNSNLTMTSDVTITGNLTVLGAGTYLTVASTNTYVNDPLIVLNNAFTGTNTYDIGMVFNRGNQTSTALIWNEAGKEFRLTYTSETGSTYGTIATSSYANVHIGNILVDYDATIRNITATNATLSGDIAVNGGDLTTSAAAFNLLNTGVTTINEYGAATSINIGAASGFTRINNSLTSAGILYANSATASASTTTGALVVTGGLGVSGNINAGNVNATNFVATTLTGTLQTAAQPNVTSLGNLTALNSSGTIQTTGGIIGYGGLTGTLQTVTQPNVTSLGNLTSLSASGTIQTTGMVYANSAVASTSTATGALVVTGGLGVSGNIYGAALNVANIVATNLTGTLLTAAQPNVTSLGNLTALNSSGTIQTTGGIIGYGGLTGTLQTAAQPNVTSLGNLTSLASSGTIQTTGIIYSNANIASTSTTTGAIIVNGTVGGIGVAGNINAGNVNATNFVATSFVGTLLTAAQPNVTSLGNLTTLSANGTIQTTGIVYGNSGVSGTLLTSAQPNVTSLGNLTSLASSGTIQTTGIVYGNSGVSGTLLTAAQTNVTSLGNLTALNSSGTIQTTGGIIGYGGLTGTLQTAAQPNVTSLGTLTGLTVSGTTAPNANASINLGSTSNYWNNIYGAAIYATNHYGTLQTAAQPNVTSLGNLTSLSASGTIQTTGGIYAYSGLYGTLQTAAQPNVTSLGNLTSLASSGTIQTTGIVYANSGIASTSTTTGALVVTGGLGVSGNINAGNVNATNFAATTLTGTLLTAAQPNVTSLGNLTSLASSGTIQTTGGIFGYGGLTGTLQTAAQTNVTSLGTLTGLTVSGVTSITNATNATGYNNGALVVTGGLGVAKDVYIQGNLYVANIVSTSTSILTVTEPLLYLETDHTFPYNFDIGFFSHFIGGTGNVYQHTGLVRRDEDSKWYLFSNVAEPAGMQVTLDSNTVYDKLVTGAHTIYEKVVPSANLASNLGSTTEYWGTAFVGTLNAPSINGTLQTAAQTNITSVGNLTSLSASGTIQTTGIVYANSAVASTSTTTGAVVITGGLGVSGNINAGQLNVANVVATNLTGTLLTAAQPNVTSLGNLTSLASSGTIQTTGGIFGYGGLTGTLQTAAQTNVTSLGNLTSLSANGTIQTTGNVIATNLTGTLLTAAQTNVTSLGNLTALNSSGTIQTTGIVYGNSGVSGTLLTAAQTNVTSLGNLTSLSASGTIQTTGGIIGYGGLTGTLQTAAQTNVTSLGNLTALSVAGATSHIGVVYANANIASSSTTTGSIVINGTVGGLGVAGNINAGNVIATNLGGTLTTAAQPNVTSLGNLTALNSSGTIQTTGGIIGYGGLTGTLQTAAQPNVTSLGNVTSLSANGTIQTTGIVYGNSGVSGTLLTAAQPNVTSLGNLTALNSSGTIQTTGGIIGYGGLTGTLQTAAQTNVTSLGNLTALSASGTIQTTGVVYANAAIESTSTTTGAIVVKGGIGLSGNVYAGQAVIAAAGTVSSGVFAGAYSDGIIFDYTTGTGRVSVGAADGLTIYNGGLANTALLAITANGSATLTGNLNISGTGIDATQTTFNVFNGTATTVNAFGAATSLTLGATTGITSLRSANIHLPNATTIFSGQTSLAFANTVTTTVNAFGAATSTTLGATTGTTIVRNSLTSTGILYANSATTSTSSTTGGLVVAGGVGVADNLFVNNGTVINGSQSTNSFRVYGVTANTVIYTNSVTGGVVIGGSNTAIPAGTALKINSTDSVMIPVGTTGQRPSNTGNVDQIGMIRFNTSIMALEYFDGSIWNTAQGMFTVIASDQFTANGTGTTYTLGANVTTSGALVSINGVVQVPSIAYAINNTTLTFTEAPANGDLIDVRRLTTTASVASLAYATSNVSIAQDVGGYGNITIGVGGTVQQYITAQGTTFGGNVNFGNLTGTIQTAAQPSITSLGTLTGLTVSGTTAPSANATVNLGTTSNWWNNIYTAAIYATNHYGTLQTAAQPNVTSLGNVTSLSASGTIQTTGIVYGNSGVSGTLLTAAQPNVTSLGTLTGLTVSGTTAPNANASINLGSTSNYWNNIYGASIYATNHYGTLQTAAQPNVTSLGNLTSLASSGTIQTTGGIIGYGGLTGTLQTAAQTNVTSVGTLTGLTVSGTIQTTGIVYGNSGVSGTLLTAAQPNVTSLGTLTGLTVSGTTAPNANASINLGSTSNYWNNVYAAAVYATNHYGTLQTAAQPNVTSLGNLTSLASSGTIQTTGGIFGYGGLTGTLQTAAQPNVTSLGNLTSLASSGTIQTTGGIIGYGGLTGTLQTAAQTNVTSVGTLTGLAVSGVTSITNATNATAFNNGALVVSGGLGVAKDVYIQGNLYVANVVSTSTTYLSVSEPLLYLAADTPFPYNYDIGIFSHFIGGPGNVYQHTGFVRNDGDSAWRLFSNVAEPASGQVTFDSNTTYDTLITGSHLAGTSGLTLGNASVYWGSIYATNHYGTLQTAAQPNITSVGTLTGLTVSSTITGSVSGTAATVTTAAQPNITSLGNLTSLSASGTIQTTGIVYGNSGVSGTLLTAAQTNITSVGTLTGLTVSSTITGSVSGTAATVTGAAQTSITSVGTLTALGVSGAITVNSGNNVTAIINGGTAGIGNIGASGQGFNTVFAKSTSAVYADVAEKYVADAEYAPGTVVDFGGEFEVTANADDQSSRIAGVVSTNPAYLMNSDQEGEFVVAVALMGRVPVNVIGDVRKGDLMVSAGNGRARAEANPRVGTVIGKAIQDFTGTEGVIEVVVGRV